MTAPKMALFPGILSVAILLTPGKWAKRDIKSFYWKTAQCVELENLVPESILLTIIDALCGAGARRPLVRALFNYLKNMGDKLLTCLLKVTVDNGADATAADQILIKMVNSKVCCEHLWRWDHFWCADHAVQFILLQVIQHEKVTLA